MGSFHLAGALREAWPPSNLMHGSHHLLRAYCVGTGDQAENQPEKGLCPPELTFLVATRHGGKHLHCPDLNPGATCLCDLEQVI